MTHNHKGTSTKLCYLCRNEISIHKATEIAKIIDVLVENTNNFEEIFSDKLNLIHCEGPDEVFLENHMYAVVLCEKCFMDGLTVYTNYASKK